MKNNLFDMTGRVIVITGGAGLLGIKHAEAVAGFGGIPVLADIDLERAEAMASEISKTAMATQVDITNKNSIVAMKEKVLSEYGRIDVLINNAANNPKMGSDNLNWSRFENFPFSMWQEDYAVGLTGAFFCCQVFGTYMAEQKKGVILNISSDLGVIAPDQRIYRNDSLHDNDQPVKPVTYSVIKHGLIGLTKYLATYWADKNIRVNSLSPGGVYNGQGEEFVSKLTNLIPLGRMANHDEYMAAVVFLSSDASSYMTGSNLIIDGGRSSW